MLINLFKLRGDIKLMKKIQDTYFIDSSVALETANQNNKFYVNGIVETTQICYYDGPKIENAPYNCINVPFDNITSYFSCTKHRIPNIVDPKNGNFTTKEEFNLFIKILNKEITTAVEKKEKQIIKINNKIKKLEPDFNDKVLRVYVYGCRTSIVMKSVAENIANSFKNIGCNVLFDTQLNDLESCDSLNQKKNVLKFNPHIIFNINHIYNEYLNDNVFNFIWFQDLMPILENNEKITLRQRDVVFSLISVFDSYLENKGIEYKRQSFCFNKKSFKILNEVKREKKIVFIGSSYYKTIERFNIPDSFLNHLKKLFLKGILFDDDLLNRISTKYSFNEQSKKILKEKVIPFIIRDSSVRLLCSLDTKYDIEIYGFGWDIYDDVKKYFKGNLSYGEELVKVYNSSTYAFCPHSEYLLQQRVFEAAACGAIPVLYDIRKLKPEGNYDESFEYFKDEKSLKRILIKNPKKKDFFRLLSENRYELFINKMINIVKNDIEIY